MSPRRHAWFWRERMFVIEHDYDANYYDDCGLGFDERACLGECRDHGDDHAWGL